MGNLLKSINKNIKYNTKNDICNNKNIKYNTKNNIFNNKDINITNNLYDDNNNLKNNVNKCPINNVNKCPINNNLCDDNNNLKNNVNKCPINNNSFISKFNEFKYLNNYTNNSDSIKQSSISDKYEDDDELFIIYTDKNGVIKDLTDNVCLLLLYEKNTLVNNNITILLSPFLAYLHKKIMIPKYNTLNVIDKTKCNIYLAGILKKRMLIIYDIFKRPKYINLFVIYDETDDYYFKVCFKLIKLNNTSYYTSSLIKNNKYNTFKQTKYKLIIISIDFMNSTEILVNKGALNSIELNVKFHDIILSLIKKYYYPYIYIHEIIGDSYVLVLNLELSTNITTYCASLAFSFIIELTKKIKDLIKIRIGISYDKLYCGYIDNNLRLFGIPINLAARLENQCKEDEISCNKDFIDKLYEENIFTKDNIIPEERLCSLKGFGEINCLFINLKNSVKAYNNIFTTYIIYNM